MKSLKEYLSMLKPSTVKPSADRFRKAWDLVENEVFNTTSDKGFVTKGPMTEEECCQSIALMHTELSECIEAIRGGNDFSTTEELSLFFEEELELADLIIRVMVYAKRRRYDLPGAIIAKNDFNKTRPHKHGKKF